MSDFTWTGLIVCLLVTGCTDSEPFSALPYDPFGPTGMDCSIDVSLVFVGAPKDGIPALTRPTLVDASHPEAEYIPYDERVVGVRAGVDVVAVPLSILRYHEIVNLSIDGMPLAITHCPLTGSSLAFVRPDDGVDFGVSGLLYQNNLVMYDRVEGIQSLWPQMVRGARCGPRDGAELDMYPVVETTWGAWRQLHPNTQVISLETGYERDYNVHPYGDYDTDNNVNWPFEPDFRRHAKERTLGVLHDSGGILYPFGELESLGRVAVVDHPGMTSAPGGAVVFWDTEAQAAMAYSRTIDGSDFTFEAVGGEIIDRETGSVWGVTGVALSGPMVGTVLDPVPEAYVAFWFSWAGFEPDATLWEVP